MAANHIDVDVEELAKKINDATGIWFHELPVTPEKMLKALEQKKIK